MDGHTTPAGAWRVEVDRRPKTRCSFWLRLANDAPDEIVKDLVLPAPPIETPQLTVTAPTVRRFP